jgi:recombinational DNA repair protein (RecF pathway)
MAANHQPCVNCGTTDHPGQWWCLQGYYGLSGAFCSDCYQLVSHDAYGKPNHPEELRKIQEKLNHEH